MIAGHVETPAFGERMRGPSALGGDWRRFVNLTRTLAVTDFRLKFFGSVLGYLWQLMRPLLLFGVLYAVFTQFVHLGTNVRFYPVVLLTNIVLFTFFSESTSASVSSVLDREGLVRKIHFPRLVIPLAVVLTAYFNLLLNFVAVLVFMTIQGVEVHWTWLELPVLLLCLGVFCTGIAMVLSSLFVRYRDVRPIWEVVLQATFYATPLLYPVESVHNTTIRELLMINPLAVIAQQTRHAVIDPGAPGAAAVAGGWGRIAIAATIVAVVVVVGFWVFNREAPRIAEEL